MLENYPNTYTIYLTYNPWGYLNLWYSITLPEYWINKFWIYNQDISRMIWWIWPPLWERDNPYIQTSLAATIRKGYSYIQNSPAATIAKDILYIQNCPAATIAKDVLYIQNCPARHYGRGIFFIFRTVRPPLLERDNLLRAAAVGFSFLKGQNPCRFCFKQCNLWLYGLSKTLVTCWIITQNLQNRILLKKTL